MRSCLMSFSVRNRKTFLYFPFKIISALFLRVHFLRFTLLLYFFIGIFYGSHAQDQQPRRGSRVIDDTTKQVYGPKTSRFYYESDVFLNRMTYHPIDTVIRNFHKYTYIAWHNNLYQDLGNIGTSITPIFYQTPSLIGATSGFNSYNLYWDDEQMRYFDTKSPYSNIRGNDGWE